MSKKSAVRAFVNDEPSHLDIDQLELDSARRALRLLKARLSGEQMDALLAADLAATDELWTGWANSSDGTWKVAQVEFEVPGLTKDQFTGWWATALDNLHDVVYPAFPEHYRFGYVPDPRGGDEPCYIVVEELGHVPFRMFCSFDESWAPVEVTPGYESMMVGVGRLANGTEVTRFMNEIKDTQDGFAMKVGVYMVSATPDDVVTSHIQQELVEWTRWIQIALDEITNV